MALRNLKHYESATARSGGITTTDQIQLVTRAAVPTDSTLANGRMVYVTGTGFRFYNEGAWFTVPTSTTGGSAGSWDTLYTSDKTLTIDSTTLTFAGTHATNAVFTITGAGTGSAIQITNSSTGADITGTSSTWSVSAAGAAVFTAVTGCDTLTAAGNLAINANGTGTISLGATSTGAITLTRAVTATASITITGSADATVLTVSAGDVSVAAGLLTLDDDDTATGNLSIPSSTATSGSPISVVANALTTGSGLKISSTNGASFSGNGGYIHLSDGTNPVLTVGRYGATVIAGNAATNVFTITAGHEVITAGNLTLTAGNLVMTSGSFTYTLGDMTMSDGSITVTDADNAATLSVTNNTATSASPFVFAGSGTFTGSTTSSFMTITPSGLTSGTAIYLPLALMANGVGIDIPSAALTTGAVIRVVQTGEVLAAGELLTLTNTESGTTLVAKTGSLVSIASSQTEAGTSTQDFDLLGLTRTSIHTTAGTLTATGSVLKVSNVATQTTATLTDTVKGIEVVMDADGTGAGVDITHAATGGVALNIVGAATSVSDVLITGSGVKATGKGTLEVTNSGATAAGGAVLKVGYTGIPAAATSYLANFDYTGGTNSTSIAVIIQSEGTGTPLLVTTSGAASNGVLQLVSTEAGTTGVILKLDHQSASQADDDVIGRIQFAGNDDGGTPATNAYARIDVVAADSAAASEDGDMKFYVCRAATETLQLWLDSDISGIVVGDAAAAAIVTSNGAYNLELTTGNNGASNPTVLLTAGANGDITLTPAGTGQSVIVAPSWTVTSKTTTATLTPAEGGIILVTTTAAWTCTLPAAATNSGLWYTFKKTDAAANALTIDANSTELIDGSQTYTAVDAQYDTATIVCDGTGWHIVYTKLA